jgi:hypothetical protein
MEFLTPMMVRKWAASRLGASLKSSYISALAVDVVGAPAWTAMRY